MNCVFLVIALKTETSLDILCADFQVKSFEEISHAVSNQYASADACLFNQHDFFKKLFRQPLTNWCWSGFGFRAWWRPDEVCQLQTPPCRPAGWEEASCWSCHMRGFKYSLSSHTLFSLLDPSVIFYFFFLKKKLSWCIVFLLARYHT